MMDIIESLMDLLGLSEKVVEGIDITDTLTDAAETIDDSIVLSDLDNTSNACIELDDSQFNSDASDFGNDSFKEEFSVSFGSQKETISSSGGIKLEAIIDKEHNTSNKFRIKTKKGIIHNVPKGAQFVEIDGIKYRLPKLTG